MSALVARPQVVSTDSNAYSSLANDEVEYDASRGAKYAPVQKSVELVSDRLRSSQRLQSALQLAASYLPALVTQLSVAGAGRLQELGSTYATPIVARVDDKISSAVETVLRAPAYGQAKVSAVDQFAYNHTPERLKPTYTRTRTRALQVVQGATDRVVALKRERGEPLWEAIVVRLDTVQKRIAQVRAAIVDLKSNAVETVQAVAHLDRLNELHARLNSAVSAAREKGEQAREFSKELIAGVTEAAVQLTAFVEANMTEQQQVAVRALWTRLVEAVATLRETLHIAPVSVVEAESQREGVQTLPTAAPAAAASSAAVAAAATFVSSVASNESNSNGTSKLASSRADGGEQFVTDSTSTDAVAPPSNDGITSSPKRKTKRKTNKGNADEGGVDS